MWWTFFALIHVVCGGMYGFDSVVVELAGEAAFDDATAEGVALVEFYAPWCGQCQQLAPQYEKAAKEMQGLMPFYAVDLTVQSNQDLAQRFQIQGFPTLMFFKDGKDTVYTGDRNTQAITRVARKKLPNIVKQVKSKKEKKKFKKGAKSVRAVYVHKKKNTPDVYKALALQFEGHIDFYESKKDKDWAKSLDVTSDPATLLLWKKKQKKPQVYTGLMKLKAMRRWLHQFAPDLELEAEESIPEIQDQSCWVEFCEKKGLCILVLAGEDEDDRKRVENVVLEYKENADRASLFGFGLVSMPHHYDWVNSVFPDKLGMYSHLLVISTAKLRYSSYVGSYSYSTVKSFINGITSGNTATSKLMMDTLPLFTTDTEQCGSTPKVEEKEEPAAPQYDDDDDDINLDDDDLPGHDEL